MINQNLRVHRSTFPARSVLHGLIVIFLLIAASIWLNWKVGHSIRQAVDSQSDVVSAAQRISNYGLVLQMSVKAAAANGDPEAAATYGLYQSELRSTLSELRSQLSRTGAHTSVVEDAAQANLVLAATEFQALELAGSGRFQHARRLLESQEYLLQAQAFQEGMRAIERSARGYVHLTGLKVERYLLWMMLLNATSLAIVLIGWFSVLRPARRWGDQLDIARASAEFAASQLREKQCELELLNQQLFRQARIDPLTGLNTRLSFNEDAEVVWTALDPEPNIYCGVMCDVDFFKPFNDTFGHPAGDRALRLVADALKAASESSDRIYRLGGEEFLVVMKAASVDAAAIRADRLRQAVVELQIAHPASQVGVLTMSMGVAALRPRLGMTVQSWLKEADNALYAAKLAGRNQVSTSSRLNGNALQLPADPGAQVSRAAPAFDN